MSIKTIEKKNSIRPMLRVDELVDYMKNKNIKFEKVSEDLAENYLRYNNNYYNLTSYKHNFEKYIGGENDNKYIDLDFAYLKDLSIIDMRTRVVLFKMIIDIEHYLKIRILNIIEDIDEEDGYNIVNKYLDKDYNDKKRVHNSIFKKMGNEYYKKIFSKYDFDEDKIMINIPIWEFLEIITFGELVSFYEFFSENYELKSEYQNIFILREISKLRNAVAHNACVLSDLVSKDNNHRPDFKVQNYLRKCGITGSSGNKRLKNTRIRQITYTLYMFNVIVTSTGVKENIKDDINKLFFGRIIHHKEYYNNNELLRSIYIYFKKIIESDYVKNNQNSLT